MRLRVVTATALSLVVLAGCTSDGEEQVSGDADGTTSYVEVPDRSSGDVTAVDPGVNGFVDAGEDPRSTFGLDVDTGSIRLARALLEGGAQVPDEAVRPEEWVNAFSYDDAPPTESDLALTTEAGPSPTLDGATVVRVGVAAREIDPEDRPGVTSPWWSTARARWPSRTSWAGSSSRSPSWPPTSTPTTRSRSCRSRTRPSRCSRRRRSPSARPSSTPSPS